MTTCVLCNSAVDTRKQVLWRKHGHDVLRCPWCGLVFRADPPADSALEAIYDDAYFRDQPHSADRHGYADYLRDEALHRANARRRLLLLSGRFPRPGRLVDVGCAAGFFVDEARRAGWDASGVDVSAAMVDWARTQLGVDVVQGTFAEADIGREPYDTATMWDYIEHSVDPRGDLSKARDHLRPGGMLALSTGDVGSLVARLSGRRWHLLTPEHHNYFFDRTTLDRLLRETGFTVVEACARSSVYSLGHLLYKAASFAPLETIRRSAARLGQAGIGSAGVPLNLFDVMTVVALRR